MNWQMTEISFKKKRLLSIAMNEWVFISRRSQSAY